MDIIKLTKNPLIYSVSRFNLGGLGALFGGAKPTKDLLWRWDWSIDSFLNFYGGICLHLVQLSVKLVICRLSFVCYHCLEYVR